MTLDLWYRLRAGRTAYKSAGVKGQLAGAVRRARRADVPWKEVVRATGLSETTLRKVVA